jgi:hypothetical protein
MKRLLIFTLRLFLVSIFSLAAISLPAAAQIDETGNTRPRPVRVRTKIQTKIKVIKVPEVKYQRISGLAITTVQPNAEIALSSINTRKPFKRTRDTDDDGVLNLENVPPGKYLLTVSLKGFVTEESEVEVKPQQLVTVPVNLAPITHDIFIKTNVPTGEVRYAPIQKQGANGERDVGGYCMVRIKNGNASIAQMREGEYNLEIHPDDVEYRPVSREIAVSEEEFSKAENPSEANQIAINLERTVSTEDFLANWLPNEWRLPPNWKIENKRMQINGAGVALLRNERFNFYKDFELKTNVRSLDNRSVGFVLRAADDKNYYLIQITGASGEQPYFLTGYIVKNGRVAETLVPANIKAYAKTIEGQKFFNLIISAKGNVFRVTLEDIETGRSFVIGIIEDQNNTFPIGAVGIGTKDASRFDVNLFHINYR